MLSKPLAFELDKNAIFLRNQEMHLHYSKLESIRKRKNEYLPDIPIRIRKITRNSSYFKENQYYIRRDNNLILKKLDKIFQRPNQINNDSEIIDGYLSVKKNSREKFRQLKQILLIKENILLKNRINNTKPVIDNKALKDEFKKSQKISVYLRKIHPNDSANSVYLNENESKLIREYEKEKMDFYLKEKRHKEGLCAGKKLVSLSIDNVRGPNPSFRNTINNKTEKAKDKVLQIDKKILGKIRYV